MNKYREHSKAKERRSCTTKTGYTDLELAADKGRWNIYRCRFCSLWHRATVGGHPLKPNKKKSHGI